MPSRNIFDRLRTKILAVGPMTVAQYMQEILTHPSLGYYMTRDVFGAEGDFITSPEISQLFGELLAIWCLDQWYKMGQPVPLQIVELGPGRGSLADDMLRVFSKLGVLKEQLSLHLVEVSPALRRLQQLKLCGREMCEAEKAAADSNRGSRVQLACTQHAFPVAWHTSLADVPRQFSIYLAHEFFDALPIHKFQKTDKGWREVLVDLDDNREQKCLRFVLSRNETPACLVYVKDDVSVDHLEVSPQSGVVVDELSVRVVEDGGTVLIVDYGHDGHGGDTFRAFRQHCQCDPLSEPGTADLTADVDFGYLRERASLKNVITYGPISQRTFLQNLGIELRLEHLLHQCDTANATQLKSGCEMLISPDKMGESFKFFGIYPAVMRPYFEKVPPSGFFPQ